jgi:hypothetical protein
MLECWLRRTRGMLKKTIGDNRCGFGARRLGRKSLVVSFARRKNELLGVLTDTVALCQSPGKSGGR